MPPLLMHLHTSYVAHCGKGIHVIWLLLMVVGISSAYFHATLSLLGQVSYTFIILVVYWDRLVILSCFS